MNCFARKGLNLLVWLAAFGMAMPTAIACMNDGPPRVRLHGTYAADSNPWQTKDSPLSLETLDLVTLLLPRGSADDWQVEITGGMPSLLRPLTPQELGGVLRTKLLITKPAARPLASSDQMVKSDVTQLHFSMLRPGQASIRIKHVASEEIHELYLDIRARPPVVRQTAGAPTGLNSRPPPKC